MKGGILYLSANSFKLSNIIEDKITVEVVPSPTSFSTALVIEINSSTIEASIGPELIILDNTFKPSLE